MESWLKISCFIPVFLLLINISPSACQCNSQALHVIRSSASGLVADASENRVKMQYFDGFSNQLWLFQSGSQPGLFFIVSNYTRTAFDIEYDDNRNYVVLNEYNASSLTQQWNLNSLGRMVNADFKLNLDTMSRAVGSSLELWADDGTSTQQFILQDRVVLDVVP